jgi:low temperature requirement protein LtrA
LRYDVPHVFMIAGVLGLAAGTRLSLEPGLTSPTSLPAASLLGGGIALYLLALGGFRLGLGFASPAARLVGGLAVLGLVPVGTQLGAAQQLLGSAVLVVVILLAELRIDARDGSRPVDRAG